MDAVGCEVRKGREERRPASESSPGDGLGAEDGEKEGDGGEEGDATSVLKASASRSRSPNGRGVRAGGRDRHPPSLYVARPSKSGWGVDDDNVAFRPGGVR